MSYERWPEFLTIPDPEPGKAHPGGIEPQEYSLKGFVDLLRDHADDPAAIYFIADMLEP
jgi:hypothetical protein